MRIYAACLASYDNDVLHGRWIDATSDVDDMQAEVNAMLRESRFPNVMVVAPDGYELAARQAGWSDGEDAISNIPNDAGHWMKEGVVEPAGNYRAYSSAEEVCEGEGIAPIMVPSAEEYAIHDSFRDYSEESADEMLACRGIKDDNPLARYFNYSAWERDLRLDMSVVDVSNGVAVFHG